MIDHYSRVLIIIAEIGAGIAAGVHFAFSTLVMDGTRRLTTAQATMSMNAIAKAAPIG